MTQPALKQWLVNHAGSADLAGLEQLVNSAYRGETARAGWTHEADLFSGPRTNAASLAKMLAGPNPSTILCLTERPGGPLLSSVFLEKVAQDDGTFRCYLGMLSVSPTFQAQGLGRYMIEQGEQQARDWGADRLVMTVIFSRGALIDWYERRGFRRTGETIPFPYTESGDSPLHDDLHFVVLEKRL